MYESLRIRPSAPLGAPHCTKEDTTILGYQIPAGTPILTNLLSAQLNPTAFPDPEVFKPERFLDEDGNICNLGSLLTFGTGRDLPFLCCKSLSHIPHQSGYGQGSKQIPFQITSKNIFISS